MNQAKKIERFPDTVTDTLWVNANIATMAAGDTPYGLMENAAIAVHDGRIQWLGSMSELPANYTSSCTTLYDCQGRLVTPGLVDCHTHLVHGGNRAKEFEMRLNGAP